MPEHVRDEVLHRTPGFSGWQQEEWRAHCSHAMVFLGAAGTADLVQHGDDAIEALKEWLATWQWSDAAIDSFVAQLDRDGQPTAYVFRCRHCETFALYADFT